MLKVQYPSDYLKKEKVAYSRVAKTSEIEQEILQRKSILNRSKRSDDLELPWNFGVGQAKAEGDCFFDSFRQGLKQIGIEVTVDELRRECAEFARNNPPGWFISAVVNKSTDVDNVDKYVERIARDEWGDSDIEGRILCQKYNVRLHIAERQRGAMWVHSIVDGEGLRSAGNIDYDQDNLIHIANRGHDHFEPILRRQEVQHGQQPIVQPPENQLPSEREHQTQDFELVQFLFKKGRTGAETPPRLNFETFEERFQSFIDQMPSYLHSVKKEGFFTNLLFGMFSILLDTKIARKLGVKKIYSDFGTAKILKVVAVTSDEINSAEDAMNNIKMFSFSESYDDEEGESESKFTSGDLEGILKKFKTPAEARRIKDEVKDRMEFESVRIRKRQGRISVERRDEKMSDSPAHEEFHKMEKGLWSNPEDDIAGLADSNTVELIREYVGEVFEKIHYVYSKYKGLLKHGISEGGKHFREAAHHGFVTGILMNFRYRYNVRINIEQLAGRGYADIILLVLGPDRKMNRVPVIVELKAARYEDVEKLKKLLEKREALTKEEEREKSAIEQRIEKSLDDGLMQALNYAKGFDLDAMPFLTFSNEVFVMSLNLDSEQAFKMNSHQLVKVIDRSTIMRLLDRVSGWDGQEGTRNKLEDEIKVALERVYYTFPSVGERQDGSLSRFLLGELILANRFGEYSLERSIFLYGEHPLEGRGESNEGRPVTTFVLTNKGENEVFIFHIREGGRGDPSSKKVPINSPKHSKITEVYISLDREKKSDFFSIDKMTRYNSLDEYQRGRESFRGELKDIPYPDRLKEAFDEALDLKIGEFSTAKFGQLFSKIGEAIFPVISLVGIEAHFRQVLSGVFRAYSSLKSNESPEIMVFVLIEFQFGRGRRVDMVLRVVEKDSRGNIIAQSTTAFELKGPRGNVSFEDLKKEVKNQILEGVKENFRYKAITDGDKVRWGGIIWNNQAVDGRSLIAMNSKNFVISNVVRSSIRRPPHRVMDISPDRTSSQQFRNDFPRTSLSEGIVRISDPQRPHGENSFPGLSTDAHMGYSSSSDHGEGPPSKKFKSCLSKGKRLGKRAAIGDRCLLDMDEDEKVNKESTGIEVNEENFDESKIDNEKLRAYQEKIKDEGNEINDQLNKLIIEIQQAQAIKRFSDTYKVIIEELFPALENIDGMQSENRSYFEQMCKLNLLRIISPIIKDVDFKSLLFNNPEKLVKDQSLLENVFASVENLISDKYKQQQLQYEDFENLENQINEEILNKSGETEGIANKDVRKTDLSNYVFESVGLSLLMGQDIEVSTDLQKRVYYETLINLGSLIHDHKNHIRITHSGDQHAPRINSLVERVKSSKLLSIAHDLYYLRKNEGNVDQSNLCSGEVKSKISLYGRVNSEYKINDIYNKFNIDEIKSYFSEDEIKKFGAEFEAYSKEVITIHSPQVLTSSGKVYVKVRNSDGSIKQLIIGSIEDIKNIVNYDYNKETLEIKLKVASDKEYTITCEKRDGEVKYYLNIEGYKAKVGDIIKSFTNQAKGNIRQKLDQLQDKSDQDYIREVRQNLLAQGVSESTFDQLKKQLDYVNEEVFGKYVSDISEELTKNNIEFNRSKFNTAKVKGAKGNKFFSIMAIYDLFDSLKDVPTLGRHDNDALKRIFGINGILDAMNDVRESLGASYIRPNGKVVTKIRPDSAIGKAFRKIPQSARKAFVKLINNPVVENITFATVAYQFGYSIDAIVKGDHHPLNYYFATSNGIKLASMSMKPISMGVGAAVKGLSATSKALRAISIASKVLGKLSVATAVVDFAATIGITIHEAVEYVKAIGSKIPLSDVEQIELFLDRILREFSPLYLLIKAIENGKTLEESYKDAIKIKDFLGFVLAEGKEILSHSSVVTTVQCLTSVKAGGYNVAAALKYLLKRDNDSLNAYLISIKNPCDVAAVTQCLASKRSNDGLSAVVQYVTSIREEYSEIIKSDCSDRSPRGCNRVCTTKSEYTGSSLGEINSNVGDLSSLDISKVLPLVRSTLGGREVYFIDKDIKYLPHVTLDEYNDGLRVVMAPSSFREGGLTCGDIINEGVKSRGSSKECNDGKVYRNCTKAFTSSGEPFIFANIERSSSSPVLYLSGPRQLIAAANYPAVMHIPKGRVNYKGSEYHDNTFIINYDTYGRIRGGTANNTIVMNYSPSMIFVRLDNGIIDAAGSKIELADIDNYISHSTANQNITTGCKTRYVDAGKGGGNNSIQNYDVYCQDEDYEIRKVNKKDTHLRSIKQTIFIVDKSSGSGANISSGNLKLKENLDVISVENADVAQLRINEHQNDYRLDFVACSKVISVKVDSFAKLVIQTKKAGITKIIKIENKSLLDIIKDMAYQKLSHAGTDIDRKIVENSKKRSKAVIIADITGSENTTAYVFAKEIAESSDNLGITVSQIQVIKGDIVLNYAVNDLSQIKLIPNNGISDEEQREYNRLLFQAVERKNLDEIRRLLVMGADVEVKGDHNLTPLSIAVRKNGGEVIDLLLDMGANINAKGAHNWTSAKWAVFDNRENLVIQLVNRGTDIGYKDNMGHTLLDTARRFGRRRIADFLREKQSEYDRDLLTAVRNRDINKVRDLLDMGANIEAQNNRGWTPLCLASQKGSLDIAKLLLDRGANIEAKGKNGWNVLHEAIYYNKPDMFKFLVERGAYINVKNGKNETPLNAARRLGRPEIESFLIAKQGEGRVRRKRRHRHGEHDRHHSSRKLLATDLSDQPEITARQDILKDSLQNDEIGYNKGGATSGASKPFSLINEGISLVKELPTNTYLAIKEVVVEGFGLVNRLVGSIYDRIPGVGEIDTVNEKTIKANEETTKYKLEFRKDIPSSTSNTPYNSADQANGNGQKQSGKHAYNYFTSKDFSRDNINYIDANLKRAYERQMPGAFKLDGKETTAETIFKMGEHYLSQVDNGTIIFLDFLIRSKGQKHISTQVKDISEQEARAYAFEITQEYKKIVEQAASKSGISMHRLNINFMEIPKEITGKIMSNKFNEISGVLKSHVEKALPGRESGDPGRLSKKNFDKFMTTFNNRINITLDESILQILHSEHNKSKVKNTEEQQRNLKDKKQPRSYLDDGSVQGLLTQAVVSNSLRERIFII